MATLSERLAYVLTFDTTSGVKSLNKFGATAEKELSKTDKKFEIKRPYMGHKKIAKSQLHIFHDIDFKSKGRSVSLSD